MSEQARQGQDSGGPSPLHSCLGSCRPFMQHSPLITQEQEGFADGFIRALEDLHKQNQLLGGAVYTHRLPPPPDYSPSLRAAPGEVATGSRGPPEEPQTVPETSPPPPPSVDTTSSCSSSSCSQALTPIDPEAQERIKAERKRLKNRIAASRCRRRKLERIARLEEKVKVLKGHNSELAATAGILREQVAQLRQKVQSHVTSGCRLPPDSSSSKKMSPAESQPSRAAC
ncbi:transcription factor jun-D-like [Rhinatrema bivittatum]|uniref:transcription factor jun-D-like n=1 Tax=Rhinatrema bivittatum TaxID=194408 RepID=UPI00112DD536|nr:transcription factor jun-D-like [Rhinatrema bivittatum]